MLPEARVPVAGTPSVSRLGERGRERGKKGREVVRGGGHGG